MDILNLTKKFYQKFDGEKGIIANSVNNIPIYYMAVKKTDSPKLIVQSCIHAREYITTYLTLKLIDNYKRVGRYGTVYFVPMLNPDGVKIALYQNPLYKANANGVDLNVNFDARYGAGRQNVRVKGSENFIGEYAFCEPETRGIRDFTLLVKPDATISYHAKGEEIYYEFFQDKNRLLRDYSLAQAVAKTTNYTIKSTPDSAGGYKDWCIEKLGIPALTIEVGNDNLTHPIKSKHLGNIYKQNQRVIQVVIERLMELKCNKNL